MEKIEKFEMRQLSEEDEETSAEWIRVAAYYRWLRRGCPIGDDLSDWLEVEKETAKKKVRS